jgi:hypothetical protein
MEGERINMCQVISHVYTYLLKISYNSGKIGCIILKLEEILKH